MAEEKKKLLDAKKMHRSQKSWKAIKLAEEHFFEGRYGRALPLLFRYEDCEARAMLYLAYIYFEGIGAIQDMPRGVSYLQKLVDFDDLRAGDEGVLAMALHRLGELHFRGIVVTKDDTLAEKHWLRGAKLPLDPRTGQSYHGSVQCQTALGMLYSNPDHLDVAKALHWHKRAIASGSIISEGAIGVAYMYGIGVEEDLETAYNHLVNAALLGNTYAKGYLAAYFYKRQMYQRCVSIGRELAAEEDFSALAKMQDCSVDHVKRGISVGCYYLALCCQYGYSISKDIDFAKSLIKKALELSPNLALDLHVKAISGNA